MSSLRNLYAELLNRQRTLTYFGLTMALLMVPVLVISGLDDRLIRGSGVWAKPLKFMASTALLAISAAWFFGRTLSVMLGLALTFVLGTASGFMLGANQPPAGGGPPVVGWHIGAADIRPAHFLGVHAEQLLPLAGHCMAKLKPAAGRILVLVLAASYLLLWVGAVKLAF